MRWEAPSGEVVWITVTRDGKPVSVKLMLRRLV